MEQANKTTFDFNQTVIASLMAIQAQNQTIIRILCELKGYTYGINGDQIDVEKYASDIKAQVESDTLKYFKLYSEMFPVLNNPG